MHFKRGADRSRVSPNISVVMPDLNVTMIRVDTLQLVICQTRGPFDQVYFSQALLAAA